MAQVCAMVLLGSGSVAQWASRGAAVRLCAFEISVRPDLAEEGEPLLAVSTIQIDRHSPVAAR